MSGFIKTISKSIKKFNRFFFHTIPEHPIARKNRTKSTARYLKNQLGFNKEAKVYDWFAGLKYYYQKGDASFSGNYYFGLAEWQESLFLIKYLQPSDLFLDIGANHGHYVLIASGYSGCHTIAIEPVSKTYEQLKRNIEVNNLNEKVTLMNIGLSNRVSQLYFSTDKGTMNKIVDEYYPNKISVPVQTLDNLNLQPAVIKIDVEGFEYAVFKGGNETLLSDNLNVIICEINFTLQEGVSGKDIVDYLSTKGFSPYYYNGTKMIALKEFNVETYNTIFVKDINLVNSRIEKSPPISIWGEKLF